MRTQFLIPLLALFTIAPHLAPADGCFIPATVVAEDLPDIPRQQALIVHHDGIETLVVESTMNAAEGNRFVWLLPLPAAPTEIEKVGPGVLSCMRYFTRPDFVAATDIFITPVLWILVLVIAISLVCGPRSLWVAILSDFLLTVGVVVTFAVLFLFNTLGVKPSPALGVEAVRYEQVGHYDVAVLRATDADAVQTWLKEHGFGDVPENGLATLDAYIREGWVVMASQLRRAEAGRLTPHPLKVVFPSEQPVFPMRLTALGGAETEVRLYIAGDTRYRHPHMHTQYASRIHIDPGNPEEPPALTDAHHERALVGYAEVNALLHSSEWLTCLTKRFTSREMESDIVLERQPNARPHLDTSYTRSGAWKLVLVCLTGIWILATPVLRYTWVKRRHTFRKRFVITICASLAICLLVRISLSVRTDLRTHETHWPRRLIHVMPEVMANEGVAALDGMTLESDEALWQTVLTRLRESFTNPYTLEEVRIERSPGNITLEHDADGTQYIVAYRNRHPPVKVQIRPLGD